MLKDSAAFTGFSVDDIPAARAFYGDTLGLDVADMEDMLDVTLGSGTHVLIYPKPNHEPATFTILNFPVADVDATVDDLTSRGVAFEQYDEPDLKTDDEGHLPRQRPDHRLVPGSGRQHPLGPRRPVARRPRPAPALAVPALAGAQRPRFRGWSPAVRSLPRR